MTMRLLPVPKIAWGHPGELRASHRHRSVASGIRTMDSEACAPPPRTALELGCGGGNNASHMSPWITSDVEPGSYEIFVATRPG